VQQVAAPIEGMLAKGGGVGDRDVVDKYSIVYFGAMDKGALIQTLPGCEKRGKWTPVVDRKEGERMTSGEWRERDLRMR
jgi:hypothetical protein